MRRPQPYIRHAFSLIELIIIISIIAVLLTLTASAAFRLLGASGTGATRTLLMRLETRLRQQMTVKADRARETPIPAEFRNDPVFGPLITTYPDLAKVIYVKLRLKADFPVTFREALDPSGGKGIVRPIPAYVQFLKQRNVTLASLGATPQPYESSVCLYMALRHGQDTTTDEETGTGGSVKQVNGFECFVDAWGTPLIFCRTPIGGTNGASLLGSAPNGFDDPSDPKNLLLTPSFYNSGTGPAYQVFSALVHPVLPRNGAPTISRPTLSPVIISAGPDRKHGLADLTRLTVDNSNPPASNDNVLTEKFR
ncbi:MAG: hypothetical protein EBV06_04760 [Planctomycetia bacterium]|nr:hypothetical protein [Planctomycetia bacterium]